MNEIDYLATKIITLEVILESLIEELEKSNKINRNNLDETIVGKLNLLKQEINESKDIDLSSLFMNQMGEA